MSLKGILEFALHIKKFRNIDLAEPGFYHLRFTITQETNKKVFIFLSAHLNYNRKLLLNSMLLAKDIPTVPRKPSLLNILSDLMPCNWVIHMLPRHSMLAFVRKRCFLMRLVALEWILMLFQRLRIHAIIWKWTLCSWIFPSLVSLK